MNGSLENFKEILDRLIMKEYPNIDGYKLVPKPRGDIGALVVIYKPKSRWNDETNNFEELHTDTLDWDRITQLTKSYYNMTGMDDEYVLAGIGKSVFGSEVDLKWTWKKIKDDNWKEEMDKTRQFYKDRSDQNT